MSTSSAAAGTEPAQGGEAQARVPSGASKRDLCPLCEGARFVRVTEDPTHPDFGRAIPCSCARREDAETRRDRLARYSRLGALRRLSFETLERTGRSSSPAAQER